MAGVKRSTWIGATAFGAVVIAAVTWFVAVSPVEAHAGELRTQTDATIAKNQQLQRTVDQLKADFAKLPEYQKQLADLQVKIPTTAQLSGYLRQIDQIAVAHQVTIVNVAPGTAQAFVSAKAAPASQPAPAATSDANPTIAPTAEPSSPASKPPAVAGSEVPAGLVDIPLALDVVGTYDNTLAFISDLQTGTPRLFLLTSLNATAQLTDQAPSGGKPQLRVGDQELTLNGFLYVLPDSSAAPTPAPSATNPAPLPGAVPGKDPLVPVAGK